MVYLNVFTINIEQVYNELLNESIMSISLAVELLYNEEV